MAHPNNKGKGTYTEKRREWYKKPEVRAYMRDWAKKNHKKRYETAKKWEALNKEKRRFTYYKKGAKDRNLPFLLEKSIFFSLIKQNCYYCGNKANPLNGIDRKDNNEGYIESNCVPCCQRCNVMKMELSIEDFIAQCVKIVRKHPNLL